MLTVLIETRNDEERLARTLASLVGGSVEGVVREVLVYDRGSQDQTALVADHAGCAFVGEGELVAQLGRARGDWLLILEPGARLVEGWTDAAVQHIAAATQPARFTPSKAGRPSLLRRLFRAARPFADGLLIGRRQVMAQVASGRDLAAIGRGLATRRLEAQIIAAPTRD